MSRREQITMTTAEVRAYLAEQRTMALATIGPNGFPHLVAMWYILRDDKLAFWTYAKSQKAVNLRRDPRLTCLIESGEEYSELRGVQIQGRAEIIDDTAKVREFGFALFERYLGGPLDDAMRQFVERQATKRIVAIVEPVDIASWDHRKLGGVY
jgi:PPOX class probable F420-dependent enzyme